MSSVGAYRTCTAQLFPKESPFRAGDKTPVTDIQGVSFNTPIMSYTTTPNAATIESTGAEMREDNPNTEKAIAQLASDVVRINKLKVDWASINQAVINVVEANELKSSDFVPANDGIFAKSGMEIDLAGKTVKATDFAVSSEGKLYADSADISGFSFQKSKIYSNLIWSPGSLDLGYTMYGKISYRNLVAVRIVGISRTTINVRFDYYNGATKVATRALIAMHFDPNNPTIEVPLYNGTADGLYIGIVLESGESVTVQTTNIGSTTPILSAPSNASVTFDGGISVDGTTLNSAFFGSLVTAKSASVPTNGSATIDMGSNNTRGILLTSSRGSNARSAILWAFMSNGTLAQTPILSGSNITLTGSDGVLTIANSNGTYVAFAMCIGF